MKAVGSKEVAAGTFCHILYTHSLEGFWFADIVIIFITSFRNRTDKQYSSVCIAQVHHHRGLTA
jgi:hypothetical protein